MYRKFHSCCDGTNTGAARLLAVPGAVVDADGSFELPRELRRPRRLDRNPHLYPGAHLPV
jgi:hypothetical protein